MPSPVAHITAGFSVNQRTGFGIFSCIMLSILPDFDFLPGVIMGDPAGWHGTISHSIAAVLIAAIIAFCITRFFLKRRDGGRISVLTGVVYGMHILMDFFTDGRGIMLLWPLKERFVSPVSLFYGLKWNEPVWSSSHLWTMFNEGVFAACILLLNIDLS